ncbi:putative ATP-dependent endonuclease of OLD family [Bisgaardia hudsonensis]|uniref:Putative ATP-dependent endonuclease of OLD family n=1 Tax=Bisgaardia hudsonensis TaxID=109472 RepID=A0A4R2N1B1_9PAST|nr:DUF2813 domain-containing protein [Bisgaardia hudsonensis]QLB13102.1 ATP-dependent endonuclease [Bisgaardia hudsonensis]TCP13329.1 putative ATP-dependent endonuclease of OLD family [Bisgaardia hudsonensis]
MFLRQVEIVGFRGIKRLSLPLSSNTVLIGENAWGKSSLLSALSIIFNTNKKLYQFTESDFYRTKGDSIADTITILCTFCENNLNEKKEKYNQHFLPFFIPHQDGYERIYFRIIGEKQENGNITTKYSFLDQNGNTIDNENVEQTALFLIARHPVYRFRDARLNKKSILNSKSLDILQQKEIQAVALLLQYYFIDNSQHNELLQDPATLWTLVKNLCSQLQQDQTNKLKKIVFKQLVSLFVIKEQIQITKAIKPIILFEDPEARLHPRMVSIAWELASYLPIQRITTTNSAELISQVDLHDICRLERIAEEHTQTFRLSSKDLNRTDLRRLTFHIHHNRSLALYARVWLLVEGETEVWILNELAELSGINLAMEGIRIVEFAQCGLRPLIKYARSMGIEWYVLADGDDAGKRYVDIAKSMLTDDQNTFSRITLLPKKDIEHFFYHSGFEEVFINLAHWKSNQNYFPTTKIIKKAIQRTSKPDLAIALSAEIEKRGKQSIPLLFKKLFLRVLNLSKN